MYLELGKWRKLNALAASSSTFKNVLLSNGLRQKGNFVYDTDSVESHR